MKPHRVRCSSIAFASNFALPQPTCNKGIRIVLRNLKQERLKRQVTRSNSPAKCTDLSKLQQNDLTKPLLPRGSEQALKVALAQNKWNEMKKVIFQGSAVESPKSPATGLKNYMKMTKNFQFPDKNPVRKFHTRQFSAMVPNKSTTPANNIIQMAMAVKKGLEECHMNKIEETRRRVNSYFGKGLIQKKMDNSNDESTEENSKINKEYLCIKRAFPKREGDVHKKTCKRNMHPKKVRSNDRIPQCEITLTTGDENGTEDIVIRHPKESKPPKLLHGNIRK